MSLKTLPSKLFDQHIRRHLMQGNGAPFNVFRELQPLILSKDTFNDSSKVRGAPAVAVGPVDEHECHACTAGGVFYRYTKTPPGTRRKRAVETGGESVFSWDELSLRPLADVDIFLKQATTRATASTVVELGETRAKGRTMEMEETTLEPGKKMVPTMYAPDATSQLLAFRSTYRSKITQLAANVAAESLLPPRKLIELQKGTVLQPHGKYDLLSSDPPSPVDAEKLENLTGFLLGNGQLLTRGKGKKCWFQYVCSSVGQRIPERCAGNSFNRNHKFDRHWLEFMDMLGKSLPYVAATDIAYTEGEWYSRKIQYRVHTAIHPELSILYGKFMKPVPNRGSLKRGSKRIVKRIPDDIDKLLTPRVLAHWFLDKGDMRTVRDHEQGQSFDCYSFLLDNFIDVQDLERLQNALNVRYGMNAKLSHEAPRYDDCTIAASARFNSRIFITDPEDMQTFVRTVEEYIPAALRHRLSNALTPKLEAKLAQVLGQNHGTNGAHKVSKGDLALM